LIELVSYDPSWPAKYETLAGRIRGALAGKVLVLEHAGSTSVPGIAAKPVIDLVLAVADSTDEPAYVPALERAGFGFRLREPDWFEHRLLKAADISANLHVFSVGCDEIERMLRFRDWLRANAADRLAYEATKRELAKRDWKDVQEYADAKSDIVREILGRAAKATGPVAIPVREE
jgi:GrpB-like predicted nucleotidyltransferase (UPF0157 family)